VPYSDPDQQRAYQREWYARRRAEWFTANGPCVDCGSQEELQLDHVDPSQKISHCVWSWSLARREVELAKCLVRCTPCHMAKTRINYEGASAAVISPVLASEIRLRYVTENITQIALGEQYGIGQQAISRIILRQTWGNVL